MSKKYQTSVNQLLSGARDEAAAQAYADRDEWQKSPDEALERNLIAFRLAMKAGNFQDSMENLDESLTKNVFLKAEILFVKATYFAQTSRHEFAASSFAKAAGYYLSDKNFEKYTLSLFNAFIAETYMPTKMTDENSRVEEIRALAVEHDIAKVQFLCDRHLSLRSFEDGDYQAAIDVLVVWTARQDALTKSDSQLALLHIADCFWQMRDLRKALLYFDQVPESVDERVRFPKAVIEAKLWQKPLDLNSFAVVTDHWRERYRRAGFEGSISIPKAAKASVKLLWSVKTGVLSRGRSLVGKVKAQSLEGQLIRLLADGPRSKKVLCESLWPADTEVMFLDDRFHQLVQRVQRKAKGLIVFDGQNYRLSEDIASI